MKQTSDPVSFDRLFAALGRSRFRSRFHLGAKERQYLGERGREVMLDHAAEMIASRLAPAAPTNDGRQTPMRGHPVFIAQHATGTCCRGCLLKWHNIPRGVELSEDQRRYVVAVIGEWLDRQLVDAPSLQVQQSLFEQTTIPSPRNGERAKGEGSARTRDASSI